MPLLDCVASFSVWFREQREIFGFGRARNETKAKKTKRGKGEGREGRFPSFLPHPSPLNRAIFRALSLLVLCSTETLATEAMPGCKTVLVHSSTVDRSVVFLTHVFSTMLGQTTLIHCIALNISKKTANTPGKVIDI